MNATFRLATPNAPGAVAIIEITGDIDGALQALGVHAVGVGQVALRDLAGVDEGLVARWSSDCCHLMPHAGPVIVRWLCEALERAGVAAAAEPPDVRRAWPEAADLHEARMLDALARAPSPRAIDLLLAQPARWRALERGDAPWPDAEIDDHSGALNRLLDPPLVVAIGASNIGKSTLLNALAQAPVSVVADEPGVTRDHVGATVLLDGLAVRWIDTPGLRAGAGGVEREAADLAVEAARRADLLVRCADANSPCPSPPALARLPSLGVGLRADQGEAPGASVQTAAGAGGDGLGDLSVEIRRRLVPDAALEWPGPWRLASASAGRGPRI